MSRYFFTSAPYRLGRFFARRWTRSKDWHISVLGAEKIPRTGGVLLVANHLMAIDSVLMGLAIKRRITFLAKNAYFNDKSLKGRIVGFAFWLIDQIPVDRSGGKAAPALERAIVRLSQGHVVGIHGEGTRSRDGLLYELQKGFIFLAKRTHAVIIPTALVYPKEGYAEVHFGEPIAYSEYRNWSTSHFLKEITHRIQKMSRQDLAGRTADIADKVRNSFQK